jgi:hypothetical protein
MNLWPVPDDFCAQQPGLCTGYKNLLKFSNSFCSSGKKPGPFVSTPIVEGVVERTGER